MTPAIRSLVPDLGRHRRRRPCGGPGRGVVTRAGVRRRGRSPLRREGSALPAPAFIQGVSQGRDGPPRAPASGRRSFPRAAHRPEAWRRREADRPRGAEVELSDGGAIPYGHLILATGARQRRLDVPGVDLPGVFALRDIADATAIRERLGAKPKVVIIGAGFIGLEIAATAASLGAEATVVEIARPMGRAVSPIMSDFFLKEHAAFGARFRLGRWRRGDRGARARGNGHSHRRRGAERRPGRGRDRRRRGRRAGARRAASNATMESWSTNSCSPPTRRFRRSATAPHFPHAALGLRTRLESVQNAVDQGSAVAARLIGKPKPYNELAWFWSDQGDLKLMIAGLAHGVSTWVVRGDPATRAFSTFGFRDGKLAVVEFGQQRRRPRRRQAHHRHDEDADAGRSGRPGVRSAGAGEAVTQRALFGEKSCSKAMRNLPHNRSSLPKDGPVSRFLDAL